MQMVKRIVGGFFLFILLMWLFAPKQELYYLLEKKLKEKDIVIVSHETLKDTWFGLNIQNADIYAKGIKMANVSNLQLNIFFLYNTLNVESIKVDESFHAMAPKIIDEVKVKYSVLDVFNVKVDALGSFGTATGVVNLKARQVNIAIPVAKNINSFKKYLKKDKTGGWKYETNY